MQPIYRETYLNKHISVHDNDVPEFWALKYNFVNTKKEIYVHDQYSLLTPYIYV